MKLLIDSQSGTIVNAEHCYIVDTDDLTSEESALEAFSDEEISNIARKHGISLMFMGEHTGWGDVNYSNSVCYSPASIREELEVHWGTPDPDIKDSVVWAFDVDKETLEIISAFAISNEKAWGNYHEVLLDAIEEVYARKVLYPLEDLEA